LHSALFPGGGERLFSLSSTALLCLISLCSCFSMGAFSPLLPEIGRAGALARLAAVYAGSRTPGHEGVTRTVQVRGKSAGRRVLPLPHRCLEAFNRIQKIMVGRDGIEPPTPGFSVLYLTAGIAHLLS